MTSTMSATSAEPRPDAAPASAPASVPGVAPAGSSAGSSADAPSAGRSAGRSPSGPLPAGLSAGRSVTAATAGHLAVVLAASLPFHLYWSLRPGAGPVDGPFLALQDVLLFAVLGVGLLAWLERRRTALAASPSSDRRPISTPDGVADAQGGVGQAGSVVASPSGDRCAISTPDGVADAQGGVGRAGSVVASPSGDRCAISTPDGSRMHRVREPGTRPTFRRGSCCCSSPRSPSPSPLRPPAGACC